MTRTRKILLSVLCLVLVGFWICDDALITLRTAENFASGEGLRWIGPRESEVRLLFAAIVQVDAGPAGERDVVALRLDDDALRADQLAILGHENDARGRRRKKNDEQKARRGERRA